MHTIAHLDSGGDGHRYLILSVSPPPGYTTPLFHPHFLFGGCMPIGYAKGTTGAEAYVWWREVINPTSPARSH